MNFIELKCQIPLFISIICYCGIDIKDITLMPLSIKLLFY